ncbi:MAG: CoA transferase [Chloroflexi bacterium]|nr:CoA transferase [Chloroflexota bacterium]
MTDAAAEVTGPLAGVRVVDLATEFAVLAGRVLADLGAEVIRVEPPGGDPGRRRPPFTDGEDDSPDGSLYWAAVSLGKRSVTLDIAADGDRDALRRLIAGADVLVESSPPGHLDGLGLGYDDVRIFNPALVYVSVSPWGQDGPLAHAPATDLTIEAAGGLVGLQGDGDRPPIPVGYPQASFHAGAQAAADAVVALFERDRSGMGQHLDVSMQSCMVWTLMHATGFPPLEGIDPPGTGAERALGTGAAPTVGDLELPSVLEVADGLVALTIGHGPAGWQTLANTLAWIDEGQGLPDYVRAVDWYDWQNLYERGELPFGIADEAIRLAVEFLASKTKIELVERAVQVTLMVAPFNTAHDLFHDPQLRSRGYWREIGGRTYPGPFAKLSRTPLGPHAPPPEPGEANGLLRQPREPLLPAARQYGARGRAFEGIKVADFAWFGVGPLISKGLADHGATVVHVESATRIDGTRLNPPFQDGIVDINRAQFMANYNSSKLGASVNLGTPEGRTLARQLCDWADIVTESFTPGVADRLGLGWEELSADHPELIMLSTSMRGETGPLRTISGFGSHGAAMAGISAITGWPDRDPAGPWGAYTDFINPRYGIAALASALFERNRSGRGQYVDLSQVETSIHFIEPLILDYTVNGRVAGPVGHASLTSCPHGVYATAGLERYVAIEVQTAEQWRALRSLGALPDHGDPRHEARRGRLADREAIEAGMAGWCTGQDPWALAERLRDAGVPASVCLRPLDLYEDAQLAHRGHFVTLDHSVMGPTPYDGLATHFSATPGLLSKAAPALGEDTQYVLVELLGLAPDEIADLAAANALT